MSGTFTCPDCGMTSHHPDDVANSYCGNCHEFKNLRVGDSLRLRAEGSWEEWSVLFPGDTPDVPPDAG